MFSNTFDTAASAEHSREFITVKNQLSILYTQAAITFIFPFIAAVCLAMVLWEAAVRRNVLIWLTLVVIHCLLRYKFLWGYRHGVITPDNAEKWQHRFLSTALISGMLWGGGAIILIPYENSFEYTLHNGLMLLVTCGLVAGALVSYAVNLWVFAAYSFPALIPPAIHLITRGDQYNSALGGFVLLYYLFIGVAAVCMNRQFNRYLEMDRRQQELLYKYENLKTVYSDFRRNLKR